MILMKKYLLWLFCCPLLIYSQRQQNQFNATYIEALVSKYKNDPRGPYKDLRWFCDDGTLQMPKEPCENGGVQHARYKDEVLSLGKGNHVFLGQILASLDYDEFWDKEHQQSRLIQYQIHKYLKGIDNGWILRKAQYYRGAIQTEDETLWGKNFFESILTDDDIIDSKFYLIRQAVKDIPHSEDTDMAQKIRNESKYLAEVFPEFMNIRIKIHSEPDASQIGEVKDFVEQYKDQLSAQQEEKFQDLLKTMKAFFTPVTREKLMSYIEVLNNDTLKSDLMSKVSGVFDFQGESGGLRVISELMMSIRSEMKSEPSALGRLALFDLSIALEQLIVGNYSLAASIPLDILLDDICSLSLSAAASGFTEVWEWEELADVLSQNYEGQTNLGELNSFIGAARKQIDWGISRNKSAYEAVINTYKSFEPMVTGFFDAKIRSSVSLKLGDAVGRLSNFIVKTVNLENAALDLNDQGEIQGLNPGYALGELVVVEDFNTNLEVNPNKIYVFNRPPADLNPVAGILNISEGNLVSHLQLLARNLAIPNATISTTTFEDLKRYDGKTVFYAVSKKGTVIIKEPENMTSVERNLFEEVQERSQGKVEVPLEKLRLDQTTIMNLADLDASGSGVFAGPKAANLGELKQTFPEHVVDGFVIPFGVFRKHLDQIIPEGGISYWNHLKGIFSTSEAMKASGNSQESVETFLLNEFEELSEMIITMPLLPEFEQDLKHSFEAILGKPLGEQPVFLRSDTNMEDLASFTGAGINLTLFNVKSKDHIYAGIKKVWASPYFERSYKWRQKYLNNPENVFPSIVVIPGVNNDMSGVMITKGVSTGRKDQITVAMSRGVGGAVEGQIAETWLIDKNGSHVLVSPSREVLFNSLSEAGGTNVNAVSLNKRIVDNEKITRINAFSKTLTDSMTAKGIKGPYDVEFGFKDNKIWLFQVRPFVENSSVGNSTYLESITPKIDMNQNINLSTKL